jgi:hypothetical protein
VNARSSAYVSLCCLTVLAPARLAWAESLCETSETTYFSCHTGKQKWISVCGDKTGQGSIQYRFGTRAHVELTFPESAIANVSLRFAHYFRARVDRFEVTFEVKDTSYAVFDYRENNQRIAGVRVVTADNPERELSCVGKVESRMSELESRLPCDQDNALNLGGCPSESANE